MNAPSIVSRAEAPGASAFARELRHWRKTTRVDLDAASRLLGVSGNYLYMIERGIHAPSAPLIVRFAKIVRDVSALPALTMSRRIPIISWVQAGRASHYEELPAGWLDWVDCVCPDPQAFAVRVVGDSMLPEYPSGNLVVCMPSFPPRSNALAVVKVQEDAATFKKVTFRGRQPSRFRLVPLNPKFKPVFISRAEVTWIYPVHSVVSPCHV